MCEVDIGEVRGQVKSSEMCVSPGPELSGIFLKPPDLAHKIRQQRYLPLIINISDTCKNQPKRLDFDNAINLSSLIVILVSHNPQSENVTGV